MALLAFEVQADWEEALRLREECDKLEKQLAKSKFGSAEFNRLSKDLFDTRQKMKSLVRDAAMAGAEMEKAFRVRDNEIVRNIDKTTAAIRKERSEIGRLGKELEAEERKLQDMITSNASLALIKQQRAILTNLNDELGKHKGEEFKLNLDLQDLSMERMQSAKESDIYKYIFNSVAQGSQDAADTLKDNLDGSFDELLKDGSDVKNIIQDIIETASGVSLGNLMSGGITAAYGQLKGIYDKSVEVRAEMQDIESTMNVFLGSAEKSQKFVSELEDAAYFNMFEFSELVEGSKQMLAYGHNVDDIIGRLNQLSEVATATHKPLLQLTDMYNRAKSIGYIDSRMQQSFASQGLVIKDILKEMGESANSSKISFEQFNRVLDYVTAEGGRFNGIMASQLNNIEAERGALADNLHTMYNEIGEIIEGTQIKTLKAQTYMVEHWKEIARIIGGVAAVCGTYRAALLLLTATQTAAGRASTAQKIASIALAMAKDNETRATIINANATTAAEKASFIMANAKTFEQRAVLLAAASKDDDTRAEIVNNMVTNEGARKSLLDAAAKATQTGSVMTLSGAFYSLTESIIASTTALLTNPITWIVVALAAAAGVVYYLATAESEEAKTARLAAEAHDSYLESIKARREEEQRLIDVIGNEASTEMEKYEAYRKLGEILPELTKKYTAYQLSQMTPEERRKVEEEYRQQKEREDEKRYEQNITTARDLTKNYDASQGSMFTEAERKEYWALVGKRDKTDEDRARQNALAIAAQSRAEEMTRIYKELNPDDEENRSLLEMQNILAGIVREGEKYLATQNANRIEAENAKKTNQERLDIAKEEAKVAKERLNTLLAVKNYQDLNGKTLQELQQEAMDKGINISEWITLDPDEMRAKIIEALTKLDLESKGIEKLPEDNDLTNGFMAQGIALAQSLGWQIGSQFGVMADAEANAAIEKAKEENDKAVAKLNSAQADVDSQKSIRQLQKEAKTKEMRIKALQRSFATGNVSITDAEFELFQNNDKLKDLLKAIKKQGGEMTEAQANDISEQLGIELQGAQKAYADVGGKTAEEAAEQAYRARKTRIDNQKKADRELLDAENEAIQAEINLLADGAQKIIRQRELDHKKEIEKIEQQRKDKIKAAEDAARAEYLASNPEAKESNFDAAKESILERSRIYQQLADAANKSYEAQMLSASVKFNSLNGIADKYNTDYLNNQKKLDELNANKNNFEQEISALEHRLNATGTALADNEIARLEVLNTKDLQELSSAEIQERKSLLEKQSNAPLTQQEEANLAKLKEQYKNLLSEINEVSNSTLNALKKNYGTIYDQIDAIMDDANRKIAKAGSDGAARLTAVLDMHSNILKAVQNDTSSTPAQRLTELERKYAVASKQIADEITEYKRQANDKSLSDEERANAQSLAMTAENAQRKLAVQNIEAVGKLNVEAITKSPEYFAAMQNASALSNKSIQTLIASLEQSRESLSDLDPKDLQTITSLMDKLMDVEVQRDPFSALKKSAKELSDAQTVLTEKTALLNAAQAESNALAEEKLVIEAMRRDLIAAEGNGEDDYAEQLREKILDFEERQRNANTNLTEATNAYENSVSRVLSATERLDKANDSVMGKVKEMSSTFRSIGSTVSSMAGNKGGEIFGKVADVVSTIMDAIVEVEKIADDFNDANRLNVEQNAANTKMEAAQVEEQNVNREAELANQNQQIVNDFGEKVDRFGEYVREENSGGSNLSGGGNVNVSGGESQSGAQPSGGETQASGAQASGSSAMATAAAIMQGIQMGMSVGTKLYSLFESFGATGQAKYEKYAKKLNDVNELTNSVNRYRHAALLAQKAENEWFSSSGLSSLKDSWKVASQSRDAYYEKLNEQQAAYRDQSKHDGDYLGNILVGSVAGAVTGAMVGSSSGNPIGTLAGAIVGGIIGGVAGATTSYAEQAFGNGAYQKNAVRAQDNLRIETQAKHRSFMWIGGQNQKTDDLRSWVKQKYGDDLFDQKGFINAELAKEVIENYGDKLQGQTQATLEELIKLREQYDEYQDQLKEYVSSLYSPLVDNFVDGMWQWFDSGRDALYAFRELASGTFRDIMNDMMKTIVLEKVMDGFEDKVKDLYDEFAQGKIDENKLISTVTGLTNDLMNRYESQMPTLQAMMTNMSDTIESLGFDLGQNKGASSGSSKVGASVNQEAMDEANGRMTAIQMILQGIWSDLDYYGEFLRPTTEPESTEEIALSRGAHDDWEEVNPMDGLNAYADSIITLKQSEIAQQLAFHAAHMNSLDGIAQQIAQSYLELQGIHDDTSSMNKIMAQVNNRMDNWEQYIKKI